MDLLLRILEGLTIGLGAPLCLHLLAKLFPYKPQVSLKETVSFDASQKLKYGCLLLASIIPFLALSFVGGFLLIRGLIWTLHQSLPNDDGNRYSMLPDHSVFLFPTVFLGLLLGGPPIDLLHRLILKEKYTEFILYGNLTLVYGNPTSVLGNFRASKVLAILILVPCAIFTVLTMDCYARFTDDQIITNRFWGFGETAHNYSQVTGIKFVRFKAPPGNDGGEAPYHVVHFNDGSIWSTKNVLYMADQKLKQSYEKEREIFAFVAEKCDKEIERYDFLNRDEVR
jgi:MFS family permease